jgi:hypothetical protein
MALSRKEIKRVVHRGTVIAMNSPENERLHDPLAGLEYPISQKCSSVGISGTREFTSILEAHSIRKLFDDG